MSLHNPDALIIGGAEVQPRSIHYIDIISPSTEKVIGRAPAAGPEDVALAVGAARAAYERGCACSPLCPPAVREALVPGCQARGRGHAVMACRGPQDRVSCPG